MNKKDKEAGVKVYGQEDNKFFFEESEDWTMDDAIDFSFMEANERAEVEAEERKLKWAREIIKKSHQKRSNKNDQ